MRNKNNDAFLLAVNRTSKSLQVFPRHMYRNGDLKYYQPGTTYTRVSQKFKASPVFLSLICVPVTGPLGQAATPQSPGAVVGMLPQAVHIPAWSHTSAVIPANLPAAKTELSVFFEKMSA